MEVEKIDKQQFSNVKLDGLADVAAKIYEFGNAYPVWLFYASMGSGKTTFISVLSKYLEVVDHVSSPTFSLVNEYVSEKIGTIYHFDFYRIEDETEALDIGIEEYFYSGKLCLIEWPEMIPSFLPESFLKIEITQGNSSYSRDLIITKYGEGSIS